MGLNPYSEDKVRLGTTMVEVFKRLWPHFMKQKTLFALTLIAVLLVAVAGRLAVTVFGYAIDNGILKNDAGVIAFAAAAYLALEVGRCYMGFLYGYLFAKVGNRILFEIREQLVDHVQALPLEYFDKNPSGRIVTRITNDVVSLGELFTEGIIVAFASVVSMIAIVVAMGAISVKMTVATLMITPPLLWIVVRLNRKILLILRDSKAKLAAINAFVAENINGMRVLQLFGRINRYEGRFRSLSQDYRDQQLKSVKAYALLWPTVSFFNAASVGIALYVGGRMTFDNAVTAGAMVAFILHIRAFMDPLHVILEKYQILQNSLSGAERIFTLLDQPQEAQNGAALPSGRLKGDIRFKNLRFRYGPELPFALDGIDLDIKSGESVALVGRTGSGKSTTISLLQRFYDPTEGEILIDGQSITSLARRELRARVGVVQQDTFMFRGTIADNIGLGDPAISRDRIERAAERACLSELLARHAGGLDARVEERGANLSFGERQLIAFARILAFDPDILILDEATSNIDSHSERLIQEATRRVREGRTSIIIAHRISTVLDCDKIVLLDKGQIKEVGPHDQLYAHGGLYRALCDAQFREHTPAQTQVLEA